MNYEKIYEDLVTSRKERGLTKEFGFEIHHILPRCLGGSDDKTNLVKLTFKEHYLAHKLLVKFKHGRESHQMRLAVNFMMRDGRRPYCRNYYKEDINNFAIRFYSHLHLYKVCRPTFVNFTFKGKVLTHSEVGDAMTRYVGLKFTRGNRKFMKLLGTELKIRVLPHDTNCFWWSKSSTVGGPLIAKNLNLLVSQGILSRTKIPSSLPDYYEVIDKRFLDMVKRVRVSRKRAGFSSAIHTEGGGFGRFLNDNKDLVILNPKRGSFIIYPRCLSDLDYFDMDYVFNNMLSYKSKPYIVDGLVDKASKEMILGGSENCHITKEK